MSEEKIIWTSEYNDNDEFTKSQYQEYLDNYTKSTPLSFSAWKEQYFSDPDNFPEDLEVNEDDYTREELNEIYQDYVDNYEDPGPLPFEEWVDGFYEMDNENQWEAKDEDFTSHIFPMIENQANENLLILGGSAQRWDGNYAGGKIIHAEEQELRDIMGKYDNVTVYEEDNQIAIDFIHHDGTDTMYLYTLPKEKDKQLELAKAMNYREVVDKEYELDGDETDEELNDYILTEFNHDIAYDAIDMEELFRHKDLLIPITAKLNKTESNHNEALSKLDLLNRRKNATIRLITRYQDLGAPQEKIDELNKKLNDLEIDIENETDVSKPMKFHESRELNKEEQDARDGMIDQLIKTGMSDKEAEYAVDEVIRLLLKAMNVKNESFEEVKDKISIEKMGKIFDRMRKNGWDGNTDTIEEYFDKSIKEDEESNTLKKESFDEEDQGKVVVEFTVDNPTFIGEYIILAEVPRQYATFENIDKLDYVHDLKVFTADIHDSFSNIDEYINERGLESDDPNLDVKAVRVKGSEIVDLIKEKNKNESKQLKKESKLTFKDMQATLPLNNFTTMGIRVSEDGDNVDYMFSNQPDEVYSSALEYDENGEAYFWDEEDNKWKVSDFMRVDFLNENKQSLQEAKYQIYVLEGGDGVYNSELVDTVYSEEQAEDRVAELRAETGSNAYYKKVYSDNEEERDEEIFDELANKEEEKTSYDYIQDRIGQQITVGEFNSLLQNLFNEYNKIFLLSSELYNMDPSESQECIVFDDEDMYTINYNIIDLEQGLIEITDVDIQ